MEKRTKSKRIVKDNFLDPKNCNKAKCSTCIFRTDGKGLVLSQERRNEIEAYLITGKSSHICHTTDMTCYGALEFQSSMFYRMGLIPENSVISLLETAKKYLNPTHNNESES